MATDREQPLWRQFVFGNEGLPDPDYPIDHVPDDERKGLVSISAVLLGFVFFAGTLWAGADIGAAMGSGRCWPRWPSGTLFSARTWRRCVASPRGPG